MKIHTKYVLICLIFLFLVLIIKYSLTIENLKNTNNNQLENFETERTLNKGTLYVLQNNSLENTEKLILDFNGENILPLLSVDPITKIPIEIIKNQDKLYKKHPINIILYPHYLNKAINSDNISNTYYTYLAVFNDGALYKKDNLSQSSWEGPLMNSYYHDLDLNKFIPFRNITLDKNGRLLGVGYDGKIYIKISNLEKKNTLEEVSNTTINYRYDEPYKNNWRLWNYNNTVILTHLIYLNNTMYNVDIEDTYLGIDFDGKLKVFTYSEDTENIGNLEPDTNYLKPINQNNDPLFKISYDLEGHLLVINRNLELKRTKYSINGILFENKSYSYDSIDDKIKNPNIIYDVIYDTDQKLYGIGSINNNIVLLKQENIFYLAPFKLPLHLQDTTQHVTDLGIISKHAIIKSKTGFIKKQEETIRTLEEAYDKEKNTDLIKFKQFCKSQYPNKFIDIDLLNKIDEYEGKLETLRNIKEELVNIDNKSIHNIGDPLDPNK